MMSRQIMWQEVLWNERKRCDFLLVRGDKFTDKVHQRKKSRPCWYIEQGTPILIFHHEQGEGI